ncbi:60 kDa SS-A/Ro ribonucleoprotein [Thalassophryne amazonica]|uniref:60 kDa SS-A/Ro ribonucleoprotein n=1 Tax=Thalassophryne amazonica TaxID=390379 RepID=UPI0014719E53|nr:60 kDa SS-A/Ro ribonucleoprotein [Thalassophryne amazonica]
MNSAGGGCSLEVNDKTKLCRFLCYGSEEHVYISGERDHISLDGTGALLSLLQEGRGCEVVEEIKRFSQDGRAVRINPSIFALAVCSQHSELKTRQAAFKALKEVCRDPAHLFAFIQYKKELKEDMKCGIWGRALRKAVANWYNDQDAMSLAVSVTKCKQREGWTHQDLLRLSHTIPAHDAIALVIKYVTKGWQEVQAAYGSKENSEEVARVLSYLEVVHKVNQSCDGIEVVSLVEEHKLEREQLLTDHLQFKQVWRALLKEMPLQSLLKILGKMTGDKILEPGSSEVADACARIQSETALKKAKIHPFNVLVATKKYSRGQNHRGRLEWIPDSSILKALDSAFYKCFTNVEPVGKRFVVAVDISTSLTSLVPGTSVSTAVAAAATVMLFARTEADTQVLAYSEGTLVPCAVSSNMTLGQATFELVKIPSDSTDCTLPITWATANGKAVDVFIVLTNNPVWTFSVRPVETLRKHRQKSGVCSKLVVWGLTSPGQTIADTEDGGFLNICGFNLGVLNIIRNLAQGLI